MKPLTILMPDVDPGLASRCADLLLRFGTVVETADPCQGNPKPVLRHGRRQMPFGSSKGWNDGPVRTTLWSDGIGIRVVFRIETIDEDVEIGMEMPRILSFLRIDAATGRLARSLAQRLRDCVAHDAARAVSALKHADSVVAALSLQIAQEAAIRGTTPFARTISLPSPFECSIHEQSFCKKGSETLSLTRSMHDLVRSRVPSIVTISAGGSSSAIELAAVKRVVSARNLDAMDMLRLGVESDGIVPNAQPPLVSWRCEDSKERP